MKPTNTNKNFFHIEKIRKIKDQTDQENRGNFRYLWKYEEDDLLKTLVNQNGLNNWTKIANEFNKNNIGNALRSGKQCRERWYNHLEQNINKMLWTEEEEDILFTESKANGNKWSEISKRLHNRSDNCVKNHYYSSLRKKIRNLLKVLKLSNTGYRNININKFTGDDIYRMIKKEKIHFLDLNENLLLDLIILKENSFNRTNSFTNLSNNARVLNAEKNSNDAQRLEHSENASDNRLNALTGLLSYINNPNNYIRNCELKLLKRKRESPMENTPDLGNNNINCSGVNNDIFTNSRQLNNCTVNAAPTCPKKQITDSSINPTNFNKTMSNFETIDKNTSAIKFNQAMNTISLHSNKPNPIPSQSGDCYKVFTRDFFSNDLNALNNEYHHTNTFYKLIRNNTDLSEGKNITVPFRHEDFNEEYMNNELNQANLTKGIKMFKISDTVQFTKNDTLEEGQFEKRKIAHIVSGDKIVNECDNSNNLNSSSRNIDSKGCLKNTNKNMLKLFDEFIEEYNNEEKIFCQFKINS